MRDTARKKDGRQESPNIGQLALAAMFDARATLYETVIHAGMSVLAGMLEDDRTRLCGPRYEHDRDRRATRAGHTEGELAFGGRHQRGSRDVQKAVAVRVSHNSAASTGLKRRAGTGQSASVRCCRAEAAQTREAAGPKL
jgi:hypothetical protein